MNKAPPQHKNKILEVEQINNNEDLKEDEDYDDMYDEEIEFEKSEENVLMIQKCLLDYVNMKSLTLCEYLSINRLREFLEG